MCVCVCPGCENEMEGGGGVSCKNKIFFLGGGVRAVKTRWGGGGGGGLVRAVKTR